jgi:predicted nucleic acid-binding protein
MKVFFDTSALLKHYIAESGSSTVDTILNEAEEIYISPITYIESNSALIRRYENKEISNKDLKYVQKNLLKDIKVFNVVLFNEKLENKAIYLIKKHKIRSLDSIQAASCLIIKPNLFVSADVKLLKVIEIEKTKTLNPTN